MKSKLLIIMLSLAFTSILTHAQNIEIIPYSGWQWGGKFKMPYGEGKVAASQNYGGALNLVVPGEVALQLEYMRQPTNINYSDYFPGTFTNTYKTNIDWYQIGGIKHVPASDKVIPFAGIGLGATNITISEESINEWAFSITGQLGLKVYLSDRLGLRFHLRGLMPIQWNGFGFYVGTGGSGAGAAVSSYIIQGDVGAGLILRLGN